MFLLRNFSSFPTIRSGSIVIGAFVEEDGRTSETVLCSFDTAAAHAESRRADVVIDLFCGTFRDFIEQKGQMNVLDVLRKALCDRVAVSRRARLPVFIWSMSFLTSHFQRYIMQDDSHDSTTGTLCRK